MTCWLCTCILSQWVSCCMPEAAAPSLKPSWAHWAWLFLPSGCCPGWMCMIVVLSRVLTLWSWDLLQGVKEPDTWAFAVLVMPGPVIKSSFSSSRGRPKLKLIRFCSLCPLKGWWVYKQAHLGFPSHSCPLYSSVFLLTHFELESGVVFILFKSRCVNLKVNRKLRISLQVNRELRLMSRYDCLWEKIPKTIWQKDTRGEGCSLPFHSGLSGSRDSPGTTDSESACLLHCRLLLVHCATLRALAECLASQPVQLA